ncbi:MAG: NUDIX domain-containing protein [Candidatus Sumerlaeota bacterium]
MDPNYRILPPEEDAPAAQAFRVERENGTRYYAYQYPHAAIAGTVVVWDTHREAVLMLRRAGEPYKDHWCFPGGFLDPGHESLEETAARELWEEARVRVAAGDLQLIDIRSKPDRDPRDHVIDVGYYVELENPDAELGEEGTDLQWMKADKVAGLDMAFDHEQLWQNVLEFHKRQP